ncbi:MAG TPA: hypothetical protein VGQ52_08550 [Gemmatimonadaceae bacterium]|nr:hypothetical protein [Gemmatimonadaceae bacterium]
MEIAPNAIRTPISLVRCVTAYESTPLIPNDASSSANATNSAVLVLS